MKQRLSGIRGIVPSLCVAGAVSFCSRFVDSTTGKAAFALCVPLFNITYKHPTVFEDGLAKDSHGLVGVACTALNIEAMSE